MANQPGPHDGDQTDPLTREATELQELLDTELPLMLDVNNLDPTGISATVQEPINP